MEWKIRVFILTILKMYFFYITALIPIGIGCILWYKNNKVTLNEWFISGAVSLFLAIIFNLIAVLTIHNKTTDIETWSGRITSVEHWPEWVERWEEMHTESYPCGTDSNGNTTYCTRIYYTTEYDRHREKWQANLNFGALNEQYEITYDFYLQVKKELGGTIITDGIQPFHHNGTFYNGDNNRYVTINSTGYLHPVNIKRSFNNKVKATPNLFQFLKVPTNIVVYGYPQNADWNQSDRLLGTANVLIDLLPFDQLNSRLGPNKRVNVIMVGMGNKDSVYGQYQQAKWIGGKKNDLVITFGGGSKTEPAKWAYVFGWTEQDIVKRNIETLLLTNPINNSLLPKIEQEIQKNYIIKDWKKFDYIKVSPPGWVYWVYVILTILIQLGLHIWILNNEIDKSYWNR